MAEAKDTPLTDDELVREGCQECGGPVFPVDNSDRDVPREQAVHLLCRNDHIWYDPARPPLAVLAHDGGRRLVAEVQRLRALLKERV